MGVTCHKTKKSMSRTKTDVRADDGLTYNGVCLQHEAGYLRLEYSVVTRIYSRTLEGVSHLSSLSDPASTWLKLASSTYSPRVRQLTPAKRVSRAKLTWCYQVTKCSCQAFTHYSLSLQPKKEKRKKKTEPETYHVPEFNG